MLHIVLAQAYEILQNTFRLLAKYTEVKLCDLDLKITLKSLKLQKLTFDFGNCPNDKVSQNSKLENFQFFTIT